MPEQIGTLRVRLLDPGLPLPTRAHPDDAGIDLVARTSITLPPGARAVVPTGIAVAIPSGHVGLLCARSGLAARFGLGVVNGPGVVDAGYRGEVSVVLVNHDLRDEAVIERGQRIAQLVVVPVVVSGLEFVEDLGVTARGTAGFGSTGSVGS